MDGKTDGNDGNTSEEGERRRGERGDVSDHDSISHVILEAKGKRAVTPHSSSSSDKDDEPIATQPPVSRKRAPPQKLKKQRPRAALQDDVTTSDETSGEEEAPPEKQAVCLVSVRKGLDKELHRTSQNRSRVPKRSMLRPQPLIDQYQGEAVWGLLACSKHLKQKHWRSCIQRICSGKHAESPSDSEEDTFLDTSFKALDEDTNESLRDETCGADDGDDRTDIRVVDPSSFILKVVSDVKPALRPKSRDKTVSASRTSTAKNKKKRKRPSEKRKKKT